MRFLLDVSTEPTAGRAALRLSDARGQYLAGRALALADHRPQWAALFDLGGHVRRHARLGPAEAQLADAARFLGAEVLGPEICAHLAAESAARTLLVRLPPAENDPLADRFARVPWEIREKCSASSRHRKGKYVQDFEDHPAYSGP